MPTLTEAMSLIVAWQKVAEWIVSHRVRITTVVFSLLIVVDILTGIKPHNPTNIDNIASLAGMTFIVVGLWARSWAAGTLHKLTRLTTHGPYSIVRNPLYLGSFLMMVGFGTLIDDRLSIWIALGPFLALFALQIRDEERQLADRFGDQWYEYARTTPRFLPRRLFACVKGPWSVGRWVANREYRAGAATAVGLVALALWYAL